MMIQVYGFSAEVLLFLWLFWFIYLLLCICMCIGMFVQVCLFLGLFAGRGFQLSVFFFFSIILTTLLNILCWARETLLLGIVTPEIASFSPFLLF